MCWNVAKHFGLKFVSLVYRSWSTSYRGLISTTSFQSGLCPVLWACSETAEVSVRASRMPRSCSLIMSCIGLLVSPMYTLPHSQEILLTTSSCLCGSTASFGRTNWDLSAVSDLKTALTPCCCGQRRSCSDRPDRPDSFAVAYNNNNNILRL